jgi:hypothetical protein
MVVGWRPSIAALGRDLAVRDPVAIVLFRDRWPPE